MKEILLVEDSDFDAVCVGQALNRCGVRNPIRRLRNGVEAMAYLARAEALAPVGPNVPSVLLLDIGLPGVTGFEILEHLQNRPAFSATLKIVFSQIDSIHKIKHAYTLGAQSFLTKPLNQSELHELLTAFPTRWLLSTDLARTNTAPKGPFNESPPPQ